MPLGGGPAGSAMFHRPTGRGPAPGMEDFLPGLIGVVGAADAHGPPSGLTQLGAQMVGQKILDLFQEDPIPCLGLQMHVYSSIKSPAFYLYNPATGRCKKLRNSGLEFAQDCRTF